MGKSTSSMVKEAIDGEISHARGRLRGVWRGRWDGRMGLFTGVYGCSIYNNLAEGCLRLEIGLGAPPWRKEEKGLGRGFISNFGVDESNMVL